MGDISTHLIFYQAYWYLVYSVDGVWYDAKEGHENPVCNVGEQQKMFILEDIQ